MYLNKNLILLFISLLSSASLYPFAVSISLLKNKQNPQKFIILVGENHDKLAAADQAQIKIVNTLLSEAEKEKKLLNQKISFLLECSPELQKTVNPEANETLLGYLSNLYVQNKLATISTVACDIESHIDALLGWTQAEFFGLLAPPGNYETFAELRDARNKKPIWVGKGQRYQAFKEHADTIHVNTTSGINERVTIKSYLQRLNTLENFVQNASRAIPISYVESQLQKFIAAKKEALDIINSYSLDPDTSIVRLAVIMEQKSSDNISSGKKFNKLLKPIFIARDIAMLTSLVKSQEETNISILLAGFSHINIIQNALLANYELIYSAHLANHITVYPDFTYNAKFYDEEKLSQILTDIAMQIPFLNALRASK